MKWKIKVTFLIGIILFILYIIIVNQNNSSTNNLKRRFAVTYLNVRIGAGTSFKKMDELKPGQKFTVLADSNGWLKIKTSKIINGWIAKKFTMPINKYLPYKYKNKSYTKKKKVTKSEYIPEPDYDIIYDRTNDMGSIKVMVNQDIWVKNHLHSKNLRKLLNEQYQKILKRSGNKYFNHPTQIFIYLFNSKERAQNSGANWVAMAATKVDGSGMDISISKTRLRAAKLKPVEKFGLKEDVRKRIWKELIKSQDKAQKNADQRYTVNAIDPDFKQSNVVKNANLDNELSQKYRKELEEKYHLKPGILDSITNEGLRKGWSFPKY